MRIVIEIGQDRGELADQILREVVGDLRELGRSVDEAEGAKQIEACAKDLERIRKRWYVVPT